MFLLREKVFFLRLCFLRRCSSETMQIRRCAVLKDRNFWRTVIQVSRSSDTALFRSGAVSNGENCKMKATGSPF